MYKEKFNNAINYGVPRLIIKNGIYKLKISHKLKDEIARAFISSEPRRIEFNAGVLKIQNFLDSGIVEVVYSVQDSIVFVAEEKLIRVKELIDFFEDWFIVEDE